ncbi:hypothetical protein TNIN_231291 [Trichonephila inaurata madagascariensis]|uniref:Uncharacterized protein n=1 Tax=Trichonephila inaurata madagascariensis TaxID=2747483 RepID=A0A8X6Y082_9ARAC|nr:hypothetical protein TNIN_231291 [Trichonephila inaurata madagascariensis]
MSCALSRRGKAEYRNLSASYGMDCSFFRASLNRVEIFWEIIIYKRRVKKCVFKKQVTSSREAIKNLLGDYTTKVATNVLVLILNRRNFKIGDGILKVKGVLFVRFE